MGHYGLYFGYSDSGLLPLRSHKRKVTFYGAISGSPWSLDYTPKLAKSILALKLSVTTTIDALSCALLVITLAQRRQRVS